MDQTLTLYPMTALAGWTLLVLLLIPYQRFKAAFRKEVVVDDFKLGESDNVPGVVSIPNRNYMNLLELPLLFYVACLMLYVTQGTNHLTLYLAWAYVGCRILHSLVHLTYNNVVHRLLIFATSNVVLVIIWVRSYLSLDGSGMNL